MVSDSSITRCPHCNSRVLFTSDLCPSCGLDRTCEPTAEQKQVLAQRTQSMGLPKPRSARPCLAVIGGILVLIGAVVGLQAVLGPTERGYSAGGGFKNASEMAKIFEDAGGEWEDNPQVASMLAGYRREAFRGRVILIAVGLPIAFSFGILGVYAIKKSKRIEPEEKK